MIKKKYKAVVTFIRNVSLFKQPILDIDTWTDLYIYDATTESTNKIKAIQLINIRIRYKLIYN